MHQSMILKITALLMVAVTVFTLASCSLFDTGSDEETTTERPAVALEVRPEGDAAILDFFNRAVNNIKASKPGVSSQHKADVKSIDTGDNDEAEALIKFAKTFAESLEKVKDSKEYGEDLNDFLPLKGTDTVSRLTIADVASIELLDVEGDQYSYDVRIVLNNSDRTGGVANAFDFEVDKNEVLGQFTDVKDTLEVGDYDVSYNECEIAARINKETNQVTYLSYTKNSNVTADVTFVGTLAELGETSVSFNLKEALEFSDFIWEAPTEPAAE